ALYDFADGTGKLLTDASGHRLHGAIAGAKWIQLEDLDRKAAEWAMSKGRRVLVLQNGKPSPWITTVEALPADPFVIQKIDLSRSNSQTSSLVPIRNEDLAQIASLRDLQVLWLHNCGTVSDAGLVHLSSLNGLNELTLESLKEVTDAGLTHLA